VGKTALVCGLIAALPELRWTAVKVTGHEHGKTEPIWEETEPGQGTDTARYLAAGAERAFLVTAGLVELGVIVRSLLDEAGPKAHLIFESNRILEHLKPDLCLVVDGGSPGAGKASFSLAESRADAMVVKGEADRMLHRGEPSKPVFQLAVLSQVSPEMLERIRPLLS
jgi:hypothetical protein